MYKWYKISYKYLITILERCHVGCRYHIPTISINMLTVRTLLVSHSQQNGIYSQHLTKSSNNLHSSQPHNFQITTNTLANYFSQLQPPIDRFLSRHRLNILLHKNEKISNKKRRRKYKSKQHK